MYGLPESSDVFTDSLCEICSNDKWKVIMKLRINQLKTQKDKTDEEKTKETKRIINEIHNDRSVVGLFSKFDGYQLERIVGSENYKKMLTNEAKDSFTIL